MMSSFALKWSNQTFTLMDSKTGTLFMIRLKNVQNHLNAPLTYFKHSCSKISLVIILELLCHFISVHVPAQCGLGLVVLPKACLFWLRGGEIQGPLGAAP